MKAIVEVKARFVIIGTESQVAEFLDATPYDVQNEIDRTASLTGVIVQYLGEDRLFVKAKALDVEHTSAEKSRRRKNALLRSLEG